MISLFELLKIGIGPSSSHTMGPMTAAAAFVESLQPIAKGVERISVRLLGSLAWTGVGHGTDRAVLLGLAGAKANSLDADWATKVIADLAAFQSLPVPGLGYIGFVRDRDLIFDKEAPTPEHPNTLMFTAYGRDEAVVLTQTWLSVGGGFVRRLGEAVHEVEVPIALPYPFQNAEELLALCKQHGLTIAEIQLANEAAHRPEAETKAYIRQIADVMMDCAARGIATSGLLPGGLNVVRRAPQLAEKLKHSNALNAARAHSLLDHVSLQAIAVNEENAAGGQVVTAPTNGAAGVLPAVLIYIRDFCPEWSASAISTYLLTATAIGGLFKRNASISGAEVGCQGEVGVASAMAAAGLCAVLGGTCEQVENAAEIAMEHHLGMTCDPIGGLVQIPCIERNAFGAIKAITAASMALAGDGTHRVSLDQVIETMRQTGVDMGSKYKETSQGGLAVNFAEC